MFDDGGRLARSLARVKTNPESCEAKWDVALAMVGEATLGDIASVEATHMNMAVPIGGADLVHEIEEFDPPGRL